MGKIISFGNWVRTVSGWFCALRSEMSNWWLKVARLKFMASLTPSMVDLDTLSAVILNFNCKNYVILFRLMLIVIFVIVYVGTRTLSSFMSLTIIIKKACCPRGTLLVARYHLGWRKTCLIFFWVLFSQAEDHGYKYQHGSLVFDIYMRNYIKNLPRIGPVWYYGPSPLILRVGLYPAVGHK